MDPALRDTANRAMRMGLLLAERSIDHLLPNPASSIASPLPNTSTVHDTPRRPASRPTRAALPPHRAEVRSRSPPLPNTSTVHDTPRRPASRPTCATLPPHRAEVRSRSPPLPGLAAKSRAAPAPPRRATVAKRVSRPSPAPPRRPPPTDTMHRKTNCVDAARRQARPTPNPKPASSTTPVRTAPPRTVFSLGPKTASTESPAISRATKATGNPAASRATAAPTSPLPITLAPAVKLPPGFYILGLPPRPSTTQLQDIFSSVSSKSHTLAQLGPAFQLAPVQRKSRRDSAFLLSHPSFVTANLLQRIMQELSDTGETDSKGRARVPSPIGVLKVSIATCSVRRAITDGAPPPPGMPAELRDVTAIPYHAGAHDLNKTCVCCRENFSLGQSLLRLQCLHTVHITCMARWLQAPHARGRCPECNLQVAPP